jgi:hypothetical protein
MTQMITKESILDAISDKSIKSRSQILQKIGVRSSATYYKILDQVAKENGISIPDTGKYGHDPRYEDKEAIEKAIEGSNSIREVLKKLEIETTNYRSLKDAAKKFELILPKHNVTNESKEKIHKEVADKILILGNHRVSGTRLKKIIFFFNLLENLCSECGQEPYWNGKDLVLQIDHINGNNKDNRIQNLRILCPNCHSQTDTFAGRNKYGP